MTTKPCRICSGTDRNASGRCRACQKRRSEAWVLKNPDLERERKAAAYRDNREAVIRRSAERVKANPEARREYVKTWNAANQAKVREYSAAWRARNPEKRKDVVRGWELRNPDKVRVSRQNRRARVKAAPGRFSAGLVPRLRKLQRGKCACCGKPLGRRFELDHIMPLALGGSNTDDNAQLLREACNRRKSSRHPIDYMQSLGRLL